MVRTCGMRRGPSALTSGPAHLERTATSARRTPSSVPGEYPEELGEIRFALDPGPEKLSANAPGAASTTSSLTP
jgi:hypothetical protein